MAEYQVGQIYEGLKESDLYILTEFFKMLGNPTRIRILFLLMEQDANVGDLAEQLGITQSAVSHQLNLLKSNKLVRRRRDGKMIFYALVDEHVQMVPHREHDNFSPCQVHRRLGVLLPVFFVGHDFFPLWYELSPP